jgi:DNA-binding Xre family transcriptional regulator
MKTKPLSTFDRLMKNPKRRKNFERDYRSFLLAELVTSLMEGDVTSVRVLAREIGVSPTVIQEIRSGKKKNITLRNFVRMMTALGAEVRITKGRRSIALNMAA